jgi:hypothetical protein
MSGTLVHNASSLVTREQLRFIAPPPATSTWKPIAHYDLVQAIDRQLAVRDIRIVKEEFALAHDGLRLFGILELLVPGTNGGSGTDYAFAMGVRTANDRSFATQLAAGARVFVCSNLAFSGDLIAMNRKHTARFDLNADISRAVDRFQAHIGTFGGKFDALKSFPLTDTEARSLICLAFYDEILPIRLLHTVADTYFKPSPDMLDVAPRSCWGLLNAMTRAVKQLAPAPAFQAATQLGKLFGLCAPEGGAS